MALSTSPSHRSAVAPSSSSTAALPLQQSFRSLPSSSSSSSTTTPLPQATVNPRMSGSTPLPLSPTTSHGMMGNDRLDPTRLSLNNGIHHGEYIIGPLVQPVNGTPVKNISEYIAKKDGTDDFVVLKVLTLSSGPGTGSNDGDQGSDDNQGRMLLYNELSILSLLQDQPGVIHQHGFFSERNYVILVLDCLVGHHFDKKGQHKDLENLQHYVIRQKKLAEKEALEIFSSALSTVNALHKKNIVHRDLKLGNMVLNRRTRDVTLTNFVLSKHLVRDGDELVDQRGSLAYVSPDVLSGQPYCGKASDMWAMGVLLYTMIYGQFPFYDSDPQELFKKIKTAKYTIPRDDRVSMATVVLIKEMMEVDPKKRITAHRALEACQGLLSRVSTSSSDVDSTAVQIVPDMEDKRNSSDVPMAMKTEGVPSSSAHFLSNMTAMQLSLSPVNPDSHSTQVPNPVHPVAASLAFPGHVPTSPVHPTGPVPFQGSAVQITTSPVHGAPISFHAAAPGRQQLLLNSDLSSAYLLTPLTPSISGGSYFTAPSPPSGSFLNTSPTHSLGSSSPPVPIPTSPPSSSHSLPLAHGHTNGCHRPVGPSQSVDSYFTSRNHHSLSLPPSASSSSSTPRHVRPTSLLSTSQQQQHSRSIFLPSVSESGRTPENMAAGSNSYIVSSPMDSIITIRSAHPRVEGEGNRHSFAGNEAVLASIVGGISSATGSSRPHMHRRRRNSSGDLNSIRARRSSQGCHVQSPSAAMEGTTLASAATSQPSRTRRRSQDHMERRRRSASREPYTLNPQ